MDMDKHFQLAEVEKNEKAVQLLTEYENELGEQLGGEVILVAYKRNKTDGSWH